MTTSTRPDRFEERLLSQLAHVVAQNPAPQTAASPARPVRARRTRLALAGAVVAGALAVTVVLATSHGGTSSAYAVAPQSDGTVSVTVNDLSDSSGLQQKLRAAGIPAIVAYTTKPELCTGADPAPAGGDVRVRSTGEGPSTSSGAGPGSGGPTLVTGGTPAPAGTLPPPPDRPYGHGMSVVIRHDGDATSATFTLNPGDFTSGRKLMISATGGTVSSIGVAVVKNAKDAPGTPCIPSPGP